MTPKNLIPFLLLTAAVVFSLQVHTRPVSTEPAEIEEPPTPSVNRAPPPPHPGAQDHDAPLTDREQHDRTIKVPIQACTELGEHINRIAGIPDSDPRKLHSQILCMRQGNIAWSRCIDKAETKEAIMACNRRLLH